MLFIYFYLFLVALFYYEQLGLKNLLTWKKLETKKWMQPLPVKYSEKKDSYSPTMYAARILKIIRLLLEC